MFENVGWGEVLVLVLAGLFILGPERLPSAAAWLGKTVRQVREYATGARDQLRSEIGPEFEELRKPLQDLRSLRDLDPRRMVTKHLFDGQDPVAELGLSDPKSALGLSSTTNGANGTVKPNGYPKPVAQQRPLAPGERPPFDPDAT